ncbi:hypothetical protein HUJ04_009051 [Dendroctonus ponderosae]|nr:hypothetical protein HUJ04_009051 [Dendroctonus ponderosae]
MSSELTETNPVYGPFFGVMGAASAIIFSALGAAYGTAKSGTGIAAMSVMRPELIMKCIIPVVMAGIIAIYGLVIAILIAGNIASPDSERASPSSVEGVRVPSALCKEARKAMRVCLFRLLYEGGLFHVHTFRSYPKDVCLWITGFLHLGAGLAVGFSGLAAGFAIGIVGDAGVRGTAQQPRLFVGMILILIFAEVLGLYGLIVAIFLYTKN